MRKVALWFVLAAISFVVLDQRAVACGCTAPPPIELAKKNADLIFQGKVVGLRPGLNPPQIGQLMIDTGKVLVIRVVRVWKGDLPSTFEMPAWETAGACMGFSREHLQIGTELLIYAKRWKRSDALAPFFMPDAYYTETPCSRTALVGQTKDLDSLGQGYPPKQ